MKNFIQEGEVIDFTAAGTVTAGTGVLIGTRLGIPVTSGVSGDKIALAVEGVFEHAKNTGAGTALTVGGIVYWDDAAKKITGVASGNTAIGWAVEAAATGDTTGKVKLLG
jgi:predicted RecA/RadA family phage recombinase